jgi:hypothetical protein
VQVREEEKKTWASREEKVRARAGGGGEANGKSGWGRNGCEKKGKRKWKEIFNQRGETGILHGQGQGYG